VEELVVAVLRGRVSRRCGRDAGFISVKTVELSQENTRRVIPQVTSPRDLVVRENPWRVYRTPGTVPV